jgi:hypothetical protein
MPERKPYFRPLWVERALTVSGSPFRRDHPGRDRIGRPAKPFLARINARAAEPEVSADIVRSPFAQKSFRDRLFGGLFALWIERAGIVDLGYLVIAEAEHLAQDLVGVLAEQRRAGHFAR